MSAGQPGQGEVVSAPFFYRGELAEGADETHRSRDLGVQFTTPKIDFDKAVPTRLEGPPLLDVPLAEIIDFLAETGQRLATVGRSGLTYGPHLFFGMIVDGQPVDPAPYLGIKACDAETPSTPILPSRAFIQD